MTDSPADPTPRRVLQWVIPADGNDHPIGSGPVLHVDTTPWGYTVAIWTEEASLDSTRHARVIADQQPIPDGYEHLGTTTKNGTWHVYGTTEGTT